MITKSQKFRLGLFFVVSVLLLFILIGSVIGKALLEEKDNYHISFKNASVSGLTVGSSVKYKGITIGTVKDISIDPEDVQNIIVTISVEEDTPIKEDVRAVLSPVGITGLMQIELSGGSNSSKTLEPGSTIKTDLSTFKKLTDTAESISYQMDFILDRIIELLDDENISHINSILANSRGVMIENRTTVRNTLQNMEILSGDLITLTDKLITVSEGLDQTRVQQLFSKLDSSIDNFNDTINSIDLIVLQNRRKVDNTINTLENAAEFLNEFAIQISEDPSLLLRSRTRD